MGRSNVVLPHYAFFEALAACSDELSIEWRTTTAGLVTLRLFDDWVRDGSNAVTSDAWTLRAVRDAIGAIEPGSTVRALLTSLVDSMQLARHARVAVVAPRLLAYARALQFEAAWALAADVYRTVLVAADPVTDADVLIMANMQLGACLRVLAEWGEAREAYEAAAEVAANAGDVMNVLKARIAESIVLMERGNLPGAQSMLDDAIRRATEEGFVELRAHALQARGNVAYRRGDFESAIRYAYQALEGMREQVARDRVLADLAATFSEIGLHSAARDANLVLAATAQEQYTRWVATINLMEIAAIDRNEIVFEQHRRALIATELPAPLSAFYHLHVGIGYRLLERTGQARAAFERALDVASRHQVNEVVFKAEQHLKEIREGSAMAGARARANASPEMAEVASAIHDLRTLAGVAD
jgi:tetratricopeptide (TPR) repeat protein